MCMLGLTGFVGFFGIDRLIGLTGFVGFFGIDRLLGLAGFFLGLVDSAMDTTFVIECVVAFNRLKFHPESVFYTVLGIAPDTASGVNTCRGIIVVYRHKTLIGDYGFLVTACIQAMTL